MSFKTFVCVICGESCTRRNSKAYDNGRACNHHEEVSRAAEIQTDRDITSVMSMLLTSYKADRLPKKPIGYKTATYMDSRIKKWQEAVANGDVSGSEASRLLKAIGILRGNGLVHLNTNCVTEEFTKRFVAYITSHASDEDWDQMAKTEQKEHQKKTFKPHKPRNDEDGDAVKTFSVKETRGSKEAPRRKAFRAK